MTGIAKAVEISTDARDFPLGLLGRNLTLPDPEGQAKNQQIQRHILPMIHRSIWGAFDVTPEMRKIASHTAKTQAC
jgi:hypothetical protein